MKKILKLKPINWIMQVVSRIWLKISFNLNKLLIEKMRVSGVSELQIDEISFKMYSKCDDGIVDALFLNKADYNEIKEITLFKNFAKKSKVILDIGANTGLFSIVAQLNNKEAKIFSFEPYPINKKRLEKNLELNHLQEVTVVENAIGDSEKKVEFAVPSENQVCDALSVDIEFTNKFYKKWITYQKIKVQQNTLDNFLLKQNCPAPELIKIDVENYELAVLRGGLGTLKNCNPIIFIESFVDKERRDFFNDNIKPLGYYCYLILKEGIVRSDSLIENPDCNNYILCKSKSTKVYLSFSRIDELVQELTT